MKWICLSLLLSGCVGADSAVGEANQAATGTVKFFNSSKGTTGPTCDGTAHKKKAHGKAHCVTNLGGPLAIDTGSKKIVAVIFAVNTATDDIEVDLAEDADDDN